MYDELKNLAIAAINYAGPSDDPWIGWGVRPREPSSPDLFRCERCGQEHADSSAIPHLEGCTAKALIDAMKRAKAAASA